MNITSRKVGLALSVIVLLLSGCVSQAPEPSETIIGGWQSELGGFVFISTFTAADVSVDGHSPVAYSLNGDQLVIGGDSSSIRLLSFPSEDEMIQVDPLTGSAHRYQRISD